MKTWNDYKKEYAAKSESNAAEMQYLEAVATFVAQIVEAREEKGLSQSDLARICGLKQSAISRMESLKTTPQLDTVIKILRPLGLELSFQHTAAHAKPSYSPQALAEWAQME